MQDLSKGRRLVTGRINTKCVAFVIFFEEEGRSHCHNKTIERDDRDNCTILCQIRLEVTIRESKTKPQNREHVMK